jgi:dTDP-4-amino-4,6-dideoxygalactose transaminase
VIPLIRPLVPALHEAAPFLEESYRTGQLTNFGPAYDRACLEISKRVGGNPLLVCNGTAALELAIAARFAPGSRIAVPDFTFSATLLAVVRARCVPVIFPCARETWAISLPLLSKHRDAYDGFIAVSPFGYLLDVQRCSEWANHLQRPVVFDLAGAWGGGGQFTRAPLCFSFHATKNLGIGEGGCVVFYDKTEYERARSFMNFSFDADRVPRGTFGGNFKMDELHAALVLAHLVHNEKRLENRLELKRSVVRRYSIALNKRFGRWLYPTIGGHPYTAVFAGFANVQELVEKGLESGIQFRRAYHPLMSDVQAFSSYARVERRGDAFFRSFLALPSDVHDNEFQAVVSFLNRHARSID